MVFGYFRTTPRLPDSTIAQAIVTKLTIRRGAGRELVISVDPTLHRDFGLSYPVTYRLAIPPRSSGLKVLSRPGPAAAWTELPVKTTSDFFNGIEAVRFDYRAGVAYVSVGFDSATDDIQLRIVDGSAELVHCAFEGICRYYDDRQAAVVVTADDWADVTNLEFIKVVRMLRSYCLPITTGIITGLCSENTWRTIQQELDSGYVEPASHSRSHPKLPYGDPVSEISGSREDLLARLRLPSVFCSGSQQYIYTWIAPYGTMNGETEQLVGTAGYLVDRLTYLSAGKFTPWDPGFRRYAAAGRSVEMGLLYRGISNRPALNKRFDASLAQGSIYHIMLHPHDLAATDEWSKPYFPGHLGYISNRKNVWYVNFGLLYLYHLLQDPEMGEIRVENGQPMKSPQ